MITDSKSVLELGSQGVDGWLIVPLLGLSISAATHVSAMATLGGLLTSTRGPDYLILNFLWNLTFFCFEIAIIAAFLKRKRILKKMMLVWLGIIALIAVADLRLSMLFRSMTDQYHDRTYESIALIAGCAICMLYFSRSHRVNAAFVN